VQGIIFGPEGIDKKSGKATGGRKLKNGTLTLRHLHFQQDAVCLREKKLSLFLPELAAGTETTGEKMLKRESPQISFFAKKVAERGKGEENGL